MTTLELIPNETLIKTLEKVSVTITGFLAYKKLFNHNVYITNKRVVVYNPVLSIKSQLTMFYNQVDFDSSNKFFSTLLIDTKQKEGTAILCGKGIFGFSGPKWKIEDNEIVDIISKNKSTSN